ncbi:MAG TPA: hypothetical protein VHG51_07370 [Longimicrobiaceae bacterium]|nr:hypothetical protein [Longimicrobiaceae bacterium]
MRTRAASPLLLVLAAALAACSEGSARAGAVAVRDSADVRIVESAAPAWREGEGWTVSAEPLVDVGVADGDPAYQFGDVASAVRLSDGRIVVADRQASHLRWFDAGGRHLLTAGRSGGGPGEFLGLARLFRLAGDSVGAWDLRSRRFSVFGPDGAFVRAQTLEPGGDVRLLQVDGVFEDGSLAAMPLAGLARLQGPAGARDTVPILRFPADGGAPETLGRFAGRQSVSVRGTENGGWMATGGVPFGLETFRAARGDQLYVADSERFAVEVYGADGGLRRVIRAPREPEPLTPEEVQRYRDEQLANAGTGEERNMSERLLEATPFPRTKSAFADMRVDGEGAVWLREHAIGSDGPGRWTVFDPEGALLGTVETPAGLRVLEIGGDYLLGVWRDELDVEHVRLYRLDK